MRNRVSARGTCTLLLAAGLVTGGALLASGGASAATTVTLRLGYVTPPAHPYGIAIDKFVSDVSKASHGQIKITTIPNYVGGDVPLLNDVIGGSVDMASVSSAVWDGKRITAFDALQMPFLINRYDLEQKVIAGPIGASMLRSTAKVGLVGLAIHEGGLRKPLGVKKPIVSLAGFRGLKIRSVQSTVLSAGLSALGASPTPIPVTDIFNALRNGTVDAMEANLGLVQTYKLYEVARYMTGNVNLWPFPTVLVINKRALGRLTPAQRAIIVAQARKVPAFSIGIFKNPKNNLIPKLCSEGIKFATATPPALAAMNRAAQPVYRQFGKNAQTGRYIRQIEALKARLKPPSKPAPLPKGCAA